MYDEMVRLLGKQVKDPEIAKFFSGLGDQPDVEDLEDFYYEFKKKGITFVFNSDLFLEAIQLFPEGKDGFTQYNDDLPAGINFTSSRDGVRAKLGEPTESGGGDDIPIFGRSLNWDLYEYDTHTLHFEFTAGDLGISLITLGVKTSSVEA